MKYLLLNLLIVSSLSLIAQNDNEVDVKWGSAHRKSKNTIFENVIGSHNGITYMLRLKYKTSGNRGVTAAIIEAYDTDLKKIKENELNLKFKGKNRDFEDVVLINGRLYLLSSFFNKKSDINYLFVEDISIKSLKAAKNLTILSQIKDGSTNNKGSFNFEYTRDSSKILVNAQWPYKKNKNEVFKLHVFNNQWKEIWSKKSTIPYDDDKYSIEAFKVDELGNAYIMGIIYERKTSRLKKDGKPTYLYNILSYKEEGELKKEYKIQLKEKFITDLDFETAKNGHLICAGFYSDQGTNSVKGTYFLKVNTENQSIYDEVTTPFSFEFLTASLSSRKKRKAAKAVKTGDEDKMPELDEFDLDRVIIRSDGGAIIIGEQYYSSTESNYDPFFNNPYPIGTIQYNRFNRFNRNNRFNNFNSDRRYVYNDIIVVNINPDGSLAWTKNISKNQNDLNRNGNYLSYAMSVTNEKLYFVFNDNLDNYEDDGVRKTNDVDYYTGGSRSVVTLATIEADGNLDFQTLFHNRNERTITMPKLCQQIGKNEMVLYGEYDRSYKFAKLSF